MCCCVRYNESLLSVHQVRTLFSLSLTHIHTQTHTMHWRACTNNSASPEKSNFLLMKERSGRWSPSRLCFHWGVAPPSKACARLISLCWRCVLLPHPRFQPACHSNHCAWRKSNAFCCFTSWSHSICGIFMEQITTFRKGDLSRDLEMCKPPFTGLQHDLFH